MSWKARITHVSRLFLLIAVLQSLALARPLKPEPEADALFLHVARARHTATLLPDGRVLIVGGENEEGALAVAESIDLKHRRVQVLGASIVPRTRHTATLLADGRVLITGGENLDGAQDTTEIFDPGTDSFRAGPRMNMARSGHTATLLKDGRVLIAGGREDGTAEVFDPEKRAIAPLQAALTAPRSDHSAILLKDGDVLLVGGSDSKGEALDTGEVFDSEKQSFVAAVNWMSAYRVAPTLKILPDGKVQVIGGDGRGTMEIYSPKGRFFRAYAHLISPETRAPLSNSFNAVPFEAVLDARSAPSVRATQAAAGDQLEPDTYDALADIRAYTATRIPEYQRNVVAGGRSSDGQFHDAVSLLFNAPASVTTDRVDYPARDWRPVISGSGWKPHEQILIIRQSDRSGSPRDHYAAAADGIGNFTFSGLTPSDHSINVYKLTAAGLSSGYIAQTAYRTGPPHDSKYTHLPEVAKVEFSIPLSGTGGVVQTDLGPLEWKFGSGCSQSDNENNGSLAGSLVPSPDINIGVEFLETTKFDFDMTTTGEVKWDAGCIDPTGWVCEARSPSVQVEFRLDEQVDINLLSEIQATVKFNQDILDVPVPGLKWCFNIPGTDISGELGISAVAGVSLTMNEPFTVQTRLGCRQDAGFGVNGKVTLTSAEVEAFRDSQASSDCPTGSLQVLQLGDPELRARVGPKASASFSLPLCDQVFDLSARLDGFLGVGLVPNRLRDGCEKYNGSFSGGLAYDISGQAGCQKVGALANLPASSGDIFNRTIKTFAETVFKDVEPPTLKCPDDATANTEMGLCEAKVTWKEPTAFDAPAESAEECSGVDSIETDSASGSVFSKGEREVTVVAKDKFGNSEDCSFTVTVTDAEKPVIAEAAVSPLVLWPPNHKMWDVTVSYHATDNCEVNCGLSVVSSEPDNGLGDGDKPNDIEIIDEHKVRLRAERSGRGEGRDYEITLTCRDDSKNSVSELFTVKVPKNRGRNR